MKLESINLKKYYVWKFFPYLMMLLTIIFYSFPFKGLHNTFNLIQKYDLPSYTYPVFIVFFLISFVLMIRSFFIDPKTTETEIDLGKESLRYKGKEFCINQLADFSLEGKHEITIKNKPVWKFTANFGKEEIVTFLLLSFKEKMEFENYLVNALESNSSKKSS